MLCVYLELCVYISRVFDMDGDICAVAGENNMAHCTFYEPIEGPEGDEGV